MPPPFYCAQMERIINGGEDGPTGAQHYLDDIIGGGRTFAESFTMLRRVFQRIRHSGMLLKGGKCFLYKLVIPYLGHILSREGVHVDPAKVEKIVNCPTPRNGQEVHSSLGLAVYHLRFQEGFMATAAPVYALTRKGAVFTWTEEHQQSFDTMKKNLSTAPVLA